MLNLPDSGTFLGRVWRQGIGPSLVVIRAGRVIDITSATAPTMRDLLEQPDIAAFVASQPGEDIGAETHKTHDQFFRIEKGRGEVVINGATHPVKSGSAIIVPAGALHNLINTGDKPMRLYTLYSPPNHVDGLVEQRKADAQASHEVFDGATTE